MMTLQQNNGMTGITWNTEDAEKLQNILGDAEPTSEDFLERHEKNQRGSSPLCAKAEGLTDIQEPKPEQCGSKTAEVYPSDDQIPNEEPTSKQLTKKEKQTTLKKPRSPYNLFFQIERELIMSKLECSPNASSLSASKSTSDHDQEGSLALEDALPGVPLPARYRGANILNPLIVINNKRRKHRKVHGKIGFVQLSRTIADRWKSSDKEEKDYFKALSVKDYQRYKMDLNKSKGRYMPAVMEPEKVSRPFLTNDDHDEVNVSNASTNNPPTDRRRKPVHRGTPTCDRIQRRRSMTVKPFQKKTFVSQDGTMPQFGMRQRLHTDFGTYQCASDIPLADANSSACHGGVGVNNLDGKEYEPLPFLLESHEMKSLRC